MEFDKGVNCVLRDVITKVDNRLQVCRNAGMSYPDARLLLFEMINKMGEASARAQGLAGSITTGRRLETSDHHLYVMKDSEGTRGHGAVIGILKVGRKRLFVYDRHGKQWEMNPLCVLDFYVHESRQRMGCGRRLFDFMLKSENLSPQHLAVDRPSVKFSSFLAKHYRLQTEIPQVNNFVIFEGFFTNHPEEDFIHSRRNANLPRPADYPITGAQENYNNPNYPHVNSTPSGHNSRPPSGPHVKMVPAGLPTLLPRHQSYGYQHSNTLKDLNLNPRSAHNMSTSGQGSPTPRGLSDVDLRSVSAGSSNRAGKGMGGGGAGAMGTGAANLPLQSVMYSRHQTHDITTPSNPLTSSSSSSIGRHPPRPSSANRNTSAVAANNKNGGGVVSATTTVMANGGNVRHRPPSGNRKFASKREGSPPLLQREGIPREYLHSLNLHQNYQGRDGHLLVTSDPRQVGPESSVVPGNAAMESSGMTQNGMSGPVQPTPSQGSQGGSGAIHSYRGGNGYYTNPALHPDADVSWTAAGALRKQNYLSARNYGRTRLW